MVKQYLRVDGFPIPISTKHVATTPSAISPAIHEFCRELSNEVPVFVDVNPEPSAELGRCYLNAEVAADWLDGEMLFGWLIWDFPNVFLTAEHHAVVEKDGQIIDVTPQFNGESRVLFLPDHEMEFSPPRPANRYVPLSDDSRIRRFVELKRRNSILERDMNFGAEYRRNEAHACRLLESFLQPRSNSRDREVKRKRRKAERQRRKRNRR